MAAKRKKAAKKAVKTKGPAKKAARKAAARKAPAKTAKAAPQKNAKKSWVAKAVASVSKLVTGKKTAKTPAKREIGEGNYAASKRFRDKEEAFIKANKKKIPSLAKAAEAALEGPEGDELRAAEASTAARGKGMDS
jgi:valyl-tRNA synthetase